MYISCTITIYFLLIFSTATDDISTTTNSEDISESSATDNSSPSETKTFSTLFSSTSVSQASESRADNLSIATSSLTTASSSITTTTTTSNILWDCLTGPMNCTDGIVSLASTTKSSNATVANTPTAVPAIKSVVTINANQWPIISYDNSFMSQLKDKLMPTNKTSTSVPVYVIASSIFEGFDADDMGIVVIDSGDNSLGEWQVSKTPIGTQFASISTLLDAEQSTTLMGTQFTNLFEVFHLPILQYDSNVRTIILLSPNISVRFQSSVSDESVWDNLSCTNSSLIFLGVNWAAISQSFQSLNSTTVIPVSNCTECLTWPISQELIRICPERRSTSTSATTTTTRASVIKSTTTTSPATKMTTKKPEGKTTTVNGASTAAQVTAGIAESTPVAVTTERPTTAAQSTTVASNSPSSSVMSEQTTAQSTNATATVENQEGVTSARTNSQQTTTQSGESNTVTTVADFAQDTSTTPTMTNVTPYSRLTTFSSTLPITSSMLTTSSTPSHDSSTRVTSFAPTTTVLTGTAETFFTSSPASTTLFSSISKSTKITDQQLPSTSMLPTTTTTTTMDHTSTPTNSQTFPSTTTVAPTTTSTLTTTTTSYPETTTAHSSTITLPHTTTIAPFSSTTTFLSITTVLPSSSTSSSLKTTTAPLTTPTFTTSTSPSKITIFLSRSPTFKISFTPSKTTVIPSTFSTSTLSTAHLSTSSTISPIKTTAVRSTSTVTSPTKTTLVHSPSTSSSLKTTVTQRTPSATFTTTTTSSKTTVISFSSTPPLSSSTTSPLKTVVVSSTSSTVTPPTTTSLSKTPTSSSTSTSSTTSHFTTAAYSSSTVTSTTSSFLKTTAMPSSSTRFSSSTTSPSRTSTRFMLPSSRLTTTTTLPSKTSTSPMPSSSTRMTSSTTSSSSLKTSTTSVPFSSHLITSTIFPSKTSIITAPSSTRLTVTTTSPLKTSTASLSPISTRLTTTTTVPLKTSIITVPSSSTRLAVTTTSPLKTSTASLPPISTLLTTSTISPSKTSTLSAPSTSTPLTTTTTFPSKTSTVSVPLTSTKTNFLSSSATQIPTSSIRATTVSFPTTITSTSRLPSTFSTSTIALLFSSSTSTTSFSTISPSTTSSSTHALTATTSIGKQTSSSSTNENTVVTLKEVSSTSEETKTSSAATAEETSATTAASVPKSTTTVAPTKSTPSESTMRTDTSASPASTPSVTSAKSSDGTSSITRADQTAVSSTATSTFVGPSTDTTGRTSSTTETTVTTKSSGTDCAGVPQGTAYVNTCGFCVMGTTGKNYTYGFDECGVCNGTNACIGCDGVAWSGLEYDQCERCLPQSDANYGTPCDAVALNGVYPMLLDSQQYKQMLTLSVADTSDKSEFTVQNCWLQDALSAMYNGSAVKGNKTAVLLSFNRLFLSGMELSVHCIINHVQYDFPDHVLITNFEQAVKQSGASPTEIALDSDLSVLVTFTQTIASKYFSDAPYCLLINGTALPALRSGDDESYVLCDMSSIDTNGTYQLRVVRGGEMRNATITYQVPIEISLQDKKPVLTSAYFSDDLTSVLINFDENIQAVGDQCARIFSADTRTMFGAEFSCSIRGATIVVTFGQNATLMPTNQIKIDLSLVERFTNDVPSLPSLQTSTTVQQLPEKSNTTLLPLSTYASTPSPIYFTATVEMPSVQMTPKFRVDAPQKLTVCQHHITVGIKSVFGDGGRPLTYTWTISSDGSVSSALNKLVSSVHGRKLTIKRSMLKNSTEYDITVKGCNFVGQCSDTLTVPVSVSVDTASFDVEIQGLSSPVLPSKRLNAAANPTFEKCGQTNLLPPSGVKYSWSIGNVPVGDGSTLRIAPFTFVVGQNAVVSVEAQYTDPETNETYTDSAEVQLLVSSEPLIVVVDGMMRAVNEARDLSIDCSPSSDPNRPANATLQHAWTCLTSTNTPCDIPSSVDMAVPLLTLPPHTLQADQMYTFLDTIKSSGLEATVTVNVTVVSADVPIITLLPLNVERPNVDDYIRFQATVSSSSGLQSTTWSFLQMPGYAFIDLNAYFSTAVRNFSAQNTSDESVTLSFTLPPAGDQMYPDWPGLATGAEYVLRIEATNEGGTAYSDLLFVTNAPPTVGQFNVNPTSSIIALETSVELSVGDGWSDVPQDQPFTYRFGLRTLLVGNQFEDNWFYLSSLDSIDLFLAAAWPAPHAVCNQRTGYQGMVMVCDRLGACSQTLSAQFIVNHATNLSVAVTDLTYSLNSDLNSGNAFGASQKMKAILQEQCLDSLDQQLSEKIAMNVLGDLSSESDLDEFADGVDQAVRLLPLDVHMQSNDTLNELARVALSLRGRLGLSTSEGATSRRKRSTTLVSTISADTASTLLKSYDELLGLGQDVVTVYLKNILDILAGFCVQLDSTRGPLAANGLQPNPLTYTQAQVIDASDPSLLSEFFSVAASDGTNTLSVNAAFGAQFSSWKCGNPPSSCIDVCIATALVNESALDMSSYLLNYFFLQSSTMAAAQSDSTDAFKYVNRSRLQSNIYYVSLVDQQQGDFVTLAAQSAISIQIPIEDFIPAQYYACYLFIGGLWDSSQCLSLTISQPGSIVMQCTCTTTGFVGIFTVSPPTPVPFPPQMEISITIGIDTAGSFTADQVQRMLTTLANATGIVVQRFVLFNVVTNNSRPILKGVLRPPFRPDHLSNSYAVQALNRTLNTAGASGLLLYSVNGVSIRAKPGTLNAVPISRALANDGNARKVTIRIDCNYSAVEQDAVVIGASWMASIASTVGIESYRIKSSSLAAGSVLMSMTVTKPATSENPSSSLSAEEVSMMIAEQAYFGELLIVDESNTPLYVYPNDTSIVILIDQPASAESRTLVIILGAGLGGFFVIVIVMVLIMVILKTRAERQRRELMWSADNALLESIQSRKSKPEIVDVEQASSSSSSSHSTVRFANSAESRIIAKKKRKSPVGY